MNPAQPTVPAIPDGNAQYDQLKSAVLGAQANPAASGSPLGSFPELARLYSSAPELAGVQFNSAAPNYNTGVQAANDRAAASASASAAAEKLKALQDPSKYQQVQTEDGGFKFYDPLGNEISAHEFAAIRNTTPSDVLKKSQNPIDIAYQQDFNNLQTYINAKLRSGNNPDQAKIAKGIEAQVKKQFGINLAHESPQQLIQQFQAAYPTIYGGNKKGVPVSTTFIPNGKDILKNSSLNPNPNGI